MSAQIYQIRDYQRDRVRKDLEQQAADILSASILSSGIDSLIPHYHDDKKPA